MTAISRTILAVTLGVLAAYPAAASQGTVGYRYALNWGGLHAADMVIVREDRDGAVGGRLLIRTTGMVDSMLKLDYAAQASPGSFLSHVVTRRLEKEVRVRFLPRPVTDERILALYMAPDPDEEKPPPLPASDLDGVMDPVTAMFQLGQRTRQAMDGTGPKSFTLPTYDGARRLDWSAQVTGRRRITVDGRGYDAVTVKVVTKPVGGFKQRAAAFLDDADFTFDLDPETWLPLHGVSGAFTAALVLNVTGVCGPGECEPGPQMSKVP